MHRPAEEVSYGEISPWNSAFHAPHGFHMNDAFHGQVPEITLEEPQSLPPQHPATEAARQTYARDMRLDINDQIAVWVSEGGAGGEVNR